MIVGFESSYLLARFNSSELFTRVIDRTVKFSSYFFSEDVRCFASESGGGGLLAGGDRRLETSRGLLGFSASALALTFAAMPCGSTCGVRTLLPLFNPRIKEQRSQQHSSKSPT
jgi:hypothetical protein